MTALLFMLGAPLLVVAFALTCGWAQGDFIRDSDGTPTGALCEDIAVPKDCQARAESIAQGDHP